MKTTWLPAGDPCTSWGEWEGGPDQTYFHGGEWAHPVPESSGQTAPSYGPGSAAQPTGSSSNFWGTCWSLYGGS